MNDTVQVSELAFEALWIQKFSFEVKSDLYSEVEEHSIFITGSSVSLGATVHI